MSFRQVRGTFTALRMLAGTFNAHLIVRVSLHDSYLRFGLFNALCHRLGPSSHEDEFKCGHSESLNIRGKPLKLQSVRSFSSEMCACRAVRVNMFVRKIQHAKRPKAYSRLFKCLVSLRLSPLCTLRALAYCRSVLPRRTCKIYKRWHVKQRHESDRVCIMTT